MKTSVAGYPRIGSSRELKVAVEQYFRGKMAPEALLETGSRLRRTHWQKQMEAGIDGIPSNDFSFYDQMLDTAVLLNAVPQRYRDLGISSLDTYFAMARGYQGPAGDVKALAMKKWFNTNYHYLVPEIDSAPLQISGSKPFDEFLEARSYGIETKPVLIGPFTFLTLSSLAGGRTRESVAGELARRMPLFWPVSMSWTRHGCSWTSPLLSVTWTGRISTCFSACMNPCCLQRGG